MKKISRMLITIIALLVLLTACNPTNNIVEKLTGITVKYSSDSYIGRNFKSVVNDLERDGFTDIEIVEISDLKSSDSFQDGSVSEISINGETSFPKESVFARDAKVIVTYRSILKVSPSLTSDDLNNNELATIVENLKKDGFTNVITEDLYDLDPDETTNSNRELTIDNSSVMLPTDKTFPFDQTVKIITHNPYVKYDVAIIIDFIPNLIFSTYNVKFSIESQEQAILEHGKDWEGTFRLKEGTYKLLFARDNDTSVKGETELDIKANTEAKYKISCHSDEVTVEVVYIDVEKELNENEVKVPISSNDSIGKNYKDIELAFKEMGFTNIKTTPVYDIYFGITEAESISKITIAGKADYKKGDIFLKDDEVIITYHMSYEDDPKNNTESTSETTLPESTTSEQEKAEKDIQELVLYQPCSYVKHALAELGYTVTYKHENTKMDFTGEIDYNTDEYLDSMGWYVAGVESIDITNKKAALFINTKENAARIDEQQALKDRLESNFPSYMAVSAVEQYGKSLYGSSFELNKITGMLAETPIDENTWFIKYTADVVINGQKYKNLNCEAKVSGPEDDPTVYDFILY